MSDLDLTEAIAAARSGVDRRLSWPSMHWHWHPDALPHITQAAVEAAAPLIVAQVRAQIAAETVRVLREHTISCTGIGEVSCAGCRGAGWMTWSAYRQHLADIIARGDS